MSRFCHKKAGRQEPGICRTPQNKSGAGDPRGQKVTQHTLCDFLSLIQGFFGVLWTVVRLGLSDICPSLRGLLTWQL